MICNFDGSEDLDSVWIFLPSNKWFSSSGIVERLLFPISIISSTIGSTKLFLDFLGDLGFSSVWVWMSVIGFKAIETNVNLSIVDVKK